MRTKSDYDVVIVGGGINGAGIARDFSGRGLRICLIEMNELASGTSSASSKLIHGGLRYLEHKEFRLVREALKEREILLNLAPDIIKPARFILPYTPDMRPSWLLSLGLFLYDHLVHGSSLPKSHMISLESSIIQAKYNKGFIYSDCVVDDTQLVLRNAHDAKARGTHIHLHTHISEIDRDDDYWRVHTKEMPPITAKLLINATGPWASKFLEQHKLPSKGKLRLVKGSHIILPKFYEGNQAYILQAQDKRVVFTIPYQKDALLVGTTDVVIENMSQAPEISENEISYLLDSINSYFNKQSAEKDIIGHYSGVRGLYDDGSLHAQSIARDYHLELHEEQSAPLLNIFGGKITTYRKLAENSWKKIQHIFPDITQADWTGKVPF